MFNTKKFYLPSVGDDLAYNTSEDGQGRRDRIVSSSCTRSVAPLNSAKISANSPNLLSTSKARTCSGLEAIDRFIFVTT